MSTEPSSHTGEHKTKILGPPTYIDAQNLAEAHWGIIWPPLPLNTAEQKHYVALQELIQHRQSKAGGAAPILHEFYYQPGWTYDQFLWDVGPGIETGNMQPDKVPYYLLIVGAPDRIPWEFQYYLDGEYAVGRLWFDDPNDCSRYIKHLKAYEDPINGAPINGRRTLLVAPQHVVGPEQLPDKATTSSAHSLVQPLYDFLVTKHPQLNFASQLLIGDQPVTGAFKAQMVEQLANATPGVPPAVLFTAGHGLEYSMPGNPLLMADQYAFQGAPLFQEWQGPGLPPHPTDFWSGDQVVSLPGVAGMVVFCFACFSAGTPQKQDWIQPTFFTRPKVIAAKPFVARLPQKLLGQGALGFIGHVSKAWEYSILGVNLENEQINPFKSTLTELLRGQRIGHATDSLNKQWATLTVLLDKRIQATANYTKAKIAATWMARNDFRAYVLLGDPAARLRVESLL